MIGDALRESSPVDGWEAGDRLGDDRLPFASVVIATTFGRRARLERCLQLLEELDYPAYEIIVVDNRADAGDERAWASRFRRTRVVCESRPGISAARNRGLAEAAGDVVAFTDDDVEPDPGWLRSLATPFVRSDDVDCVTGLVLPMELETPAQRWMEQFGGFAKGDQARVYDLANNRTFGFLFPYDGGRFGTGANMAFRTAALRRLGGFDEALGTGTPARGGEDLAAFVNVLWSGRRLAYQPSAVVRHAHRRSYDGLVGQIHGYGIGLSAMLTSLVWRDPRHLPRLVVRVPSGLFWLFSPSSKRNAGRRSDYPKELARVEVTGLLAGPFAYLRSRRLMRRWSA